ncbi:MAG: terminase small subunit [Deltaproteobacteria bacterium]|nr:terminase small subunit [Deltaproteobacteria bacterium]
MRTRKIDDNRLIALLDEGKLQKDIARELGVSEPAITKRMKKLFPERYTMPEAYNGLTEKEQKFVLQKVKGKNNTEAALVTYECNSRETAKAVGSQLMDKPEIQQSITEIMNQTGLTRQYRISRLKAHVDNQVDPHVSLKGLDMAFRLGNDYPAQKSVNLNIEAHTILNIDNYRIKYEKDED